MSSDHESDDEGSNEKPWGGVKGKVLMVDVSSGMWSSEAAPITAALEACLALVRRTIAEASTSLLGIAFFGTQKSNDNVLENVVQLFELKQLTIEEVKLLKELCSNIEQVREKWKPSDNFNLSNALWQASRMFSNCKKKMNMQSVIILSCFSEPDSVHHRSILKRAKDLVDLDIDTTWINVSENSVPEDSFYAQLDSVLFERSPDEWTLPASVTAPEDILMLIWQNTYRKSASARIKMILGPDVTLGVALYHLCKAKGLPKKVSLHRETNELVQNTSITYRAGDPKMKQVLLSEICMYQNKGGRNVEVTYAELLELRKFGGAPSIKLLGFKPSSILAKEKYFLKECAFLFPDESSIVGSTTLFRCLRDRCIVKDQVAICIMVSRWYSHPRLVALVPQEEKLANGHQIQPDGFYVVYMPYIDNFKDVNLESSANPSDEQLECMRKIIEKLKFKYSINNFENPKLQSLYNALETLALDESEREEINDTTQPDLDYQKNRLGCLSDNYEALFGPFGAAPKKRTASGNNEGTLSNKKQSTDDSPNLEMLASRVSNREIEKYTVAELKTILKWRKPPDLPAMTGLKKNALVELVYKHCQQI